MCDLADHRVKTGELLTRMRDETPDELIAPNAFLYAAERFGLIAAIDSWAVTQAVNLIAEQPVRAAESCSASTFVLRVNLSGRSISDPTIDAHIGRALQDSGIDPSCLIFELTETAAIGTSKRPSRSASAAADSLSTTSAPALPRLLPQEAAV